MKRVPAAPINASEQLLINQHKTIFKGTRLCNSANKCAGSAHNNRNHQVRNGVSSKAARRMELGGHIQTQDAAGR